MDTSQILGEIQRALHAMQNDIERLSKSISSLEGRVLSTTTSSQQSTKISLPQEMSIQGVSDVSQAKNSRAIPESPTRPTDSGSIKGDVVDRKSSPSSPASPIQISKIILTTYPGQSGINPIPMSWGQGDPTRRGPVVVSRGKTTVRRRNAIGAHGGSYSIYYALAVASKNLDSDHIPDFTNTEPAVNIGPYPQWADPKKIVSMDPFGHEAPRIFYDLARKEQIDIRPTIAITKAHMHLPEMEEGVRSGQLKVDGKICLNDKGDLAVTKFAVEPVWYLPGVAERFGIDEGTLRRSLFENTGGSYPELITRGDIKLFLPPIGGLTVYVFGDPAKMSDPRAKLALRVHDECNGSDVFGSDICTCRPYLTFGVLEAVKEAQNKDSGVGVVIYFRKEGRALGEVTKYLVYNARKRGEDRASDYFKRTENIAGVKDMRFQSLMPDVLHWLGISKIDRMLSMSNMKYDAIVEQGIPILERVPIPEELVPEDSRVEIDAKIHAGYFTNGLQITDDDLARVHGRAWDDVDH